MDQQDIRIYPTFPPEPYRSQIWQLREEVLRKPLGLSLRDEDLSAESGQVTFAAIRKGAAGADRVAGCLMMVTDYHPGVAKLRQMAVDPLAQLAGTGRRLMSSAEDYCRINGYHSIVLHARRSAEAFYAKLGYSVEGEPFTEVTIPHVRMQKEL